MNKLTKALILILAVLAVVLLFFYFKPFIEPDIIPDDRPDEQVIQEWIDEQPIVITEDGEPKRAVAAEWLEAIRQYLLTDQYGQEIGYVTHRGLVAYIKGNTSPVTSKKPVPITPPAPVPVPVPMPPPVPNITPPVPTPPPFPIPNMTPPVPVPVPVPTPSPTPPPPVPTPTPTPTPPPPTPVPVPTPPPPAAVCGNGIVESGEQCDPPNTPTCNANCQIIIPPPMPPHCTDGFWNGDESDLDCGGSCQTCPPPACPQCLSCWSNSDCTTGNCDMSGAMPLPAIDPNTGTPYNTIQQIRVLSGQSWIIPYQGRCV